MKPLYTILILLSLAGCGKKEAVRRKMSSIDSITNAIQNVRQAAYDEGAIDVLDLLIKEGRRDLIPVRNNIVEKHNLCIDTVVKYLRVHTSYKKYSIMLDSLGNGDIGKSDLK